MAHCQVDVINTLLMSSFMEDNRNKVDKTALIECLMKQQQNNKQQQFI